MQRFETTQGPTHPAVNQFWVLWRLFFCDLFFLLSSRFSRSSYTRESANPVAVQLQFSCSLYLQGFFRFSMRSSLVFLRARPLSLPSRFSVTEPSLFSLLFSLFPLLSLLLFSQIPLRDCHFDLCMRPSTSRQTASSFGDTPILIQKRFSHLVAYTSTSAQYPNEYANLAFPFSRSCFFLSSREAAHPAEM